MKKVLSLTIPMQTVSELNIKEHWLKKAKRHTHQQWAIKAELLKANVKIPLPCIVELTRISPRFLDSHDNLPSAFKWIVDMISLYILINENIKNDRINVRGLFDSDPRIIWKYAQEKGKPQSIRIEIFH